MGNTELPLKVNKRIQFKTQVAKNKQASKQVNETSSDCFSDTWEWKSKSLAPQVNKQLGWYSIFKIHKHKCTNFIVTKRPILWLIHLINV